jgi:hypothetical protein
MPFAIQNPNPPNSQLLTRGLPKNLGTLSANNQAVQFLVSNLRDAPNGTDALTIQVNPTGTLAGGTFILEGSIDGGLSWFTVVVSSATAGGNNSTAITGITAPAPVDTAAIFAGTWNITGLSGATLFRFGLSAFTSGSGAVWAYTP